MSLSQGEHTEGTFSDVNAQVDLSLSQGEHTEGTFSDVAGSDDNCVCLAESAKLNLIFRR